MNKEFNLMRLFTCILLFSFSYIAYGLELIYIPLDYEIIGVFDENYIFYNEKSHSLHYSDDFQEFKELYRFDSKTKCYMQLENVIKCFTEDVDKESVKKEILKARKDIYTYSERKKNKKAMFLKINKKIRELHIEQKIPPKTYYEYTRLRQKDGKNCIIDFKIISNGKEHTLNKINDLKICDYVFLDIKKWSNVLSINDQKSIYFWDSKSNNIKHFSFPKNNIEVNWVVGYFQRSKVVFFCEMASKNKYWDISENYMDIFTSNPLYLGNVENGLIQKFNPYEYYPEKAFVDYKIDGFDNYRLYGLNKCSGASLISDNKILLKYHINIDDVHTRLYLVYDIHSIIKGLKYTLGIKEDLE